MNLSVNATGSKVFLVSEGYKRKGAKTQRGPLWCVVDSNVRTKKDKFLLTSLDVFV